MYRLAEYLVMRLLIAVSAFFVGACNHSGSVETDYFDENGTGTELSSQVLYMDSARIGIYCNYVIGDKFILDRNISTHRYEIFTIKGDSLIFENKFMNLGNGPYEMRNPKFKYDQQGNRMFVYSRDNLENKLFVINLNDFKNIYEPTSWEKRQLPLLYMRMRIEIVNDTVFLNKNDTGTPNMFSLSYAGGKDNDFKCLDFEYPGEHPGLSLEAQDFLFKGELEKNPETLTFIYSCYFCQYVFIFDLLNQQITNIRCISKVLPVYKVTGDQYNSFAIADQYKGGFNCMRVTDKYIYIGYNNLTWGEMRNRANFKGYPNGYFDRINVFDWSGNFVKRLVLDKPVSLFVPDLNNRHLYASTIDLTKEGQPDQVLRFDLTEN